MVGRVFEYDDYPRDKERLLATLDKLNSRYRHFKANVFAIPKEMTPGDFAEIERRSHFVRLYPHGFKHAKGECRYRDHFRRYFRLLDRMAADSRWGKVFKAPWHGISGTMAQALHDRGFAFACRAYVDFPLPVPGDWQAWNIETAEYQARCDGSYDHSRFIEAHPVYESARMVRAKLTEISRSNLRKWQRPWSRSRDRWMFVDDMLKPACVKLHLGCGGHVWDGWINLDPRHEIDPRIVDWDFTRQIPVSDCKADVVFTSHVFNYVAEDKYDEALLDIWRVLRPGGVLRMAEDRTDNGYVWRRPGQQARGTGIIRSLPTKQKIYASLTRVGFEIHDAVPGETLSPHKDVLAGDSRARRYNRGHKFYVEAVKRVHHYSVSRVRKTDTRARPFRRYVLPTANICWHPDARQPDC